MIEVDDKNFQEKVIEQSKKTPIVVDFWAPWCVPCKIISPTLERFEKEYKRKFILAKINIGVNKKTATDYRIMSIPSVKLFKKGKVVAEFIGALSEDVIKEWFKRNLGQF